MVAFPVCLQYASPFWSAGFSIYFTDTFSSPSIKWFYFVIYRLHLPVAHCVLVGTGLLMHSLCFHSKWHYIGHISEEPVAWTKWQYLRAHEWKQTRLSFCTHSTFCHSLSGPSCLFESLLRKSLICYCLTTSRVSLICNNNNNNKTSALPMFPWSCLHLRPLCFTVTDLESTDPSV